MPDSYEDYHDQHGGDEPWGVMPCGAYVDGPRQYQSHRRNCLDCHRLIAEQKADEARHEHEYRQKKWGGFEGPDELTVDEHGLPYE